MDARREEHLVGVGVAEAVEGALVEQEETDLVTPRAQEISVHERDPTSK